MKKLFSRGNQALIPFMAVGIIVLVLGAALQRQVMVGAGMGIFAVGVVAYLIGLNCLMEGGS